MKKTKLILIIFLLLILGLVGFFLREKIVSFLPGFGANQLAFVSEDKVIIYNFKTKKEKKVEIKDADKVSWSPDRNYLLIETYQWISENEAGLGKTLKEIFFPSTEAAFGWVYKKAFLLDLKNDKIILLLEPIFGKVWWDKKGNLYYQEQYYQGKKFVSGSGMEPAWWINQKPVPIENFDQEKVAYRFFDWDFREKKWREIKSGPKEQAPYELIWFSDNQERFCIEEVESKEQFCVSLKKNKEMDFCYFTRHCLWRDDFNCLVCGISSSLGFSFFPLNIEELRTKKELEINTEEISFWRSGLAVAWKDNKTLLIAEITKKQDETFKGELRFSLFDVQTKNFTDLNIEPVTVCNYYHYFGPSSDFKPLISPDKSMFAVELDPCGRRATPSFYIYVFSFSDGFLVKFKGKGASWAP